MSKTVSLVWFRADLRLADNPALTAAARAGAVVPVFVWSPDEEGKWPPGAASRWWQQQSLRALDAALQRLGSRLILARGPTVLALLRRAGQSGARAIFFNRRFEPAARKAEVQLTADAEAAGLRVAAFTHLRAAQCRSARRLAAGVYRLPAGGCWHARTADDWLDAQSCAHGGGFVSDQAPAAELAGRRPLVLGTTGGC